MEKEECGLAELGCDLTQINFNPSEEKAQGSTSC